MPHFEGPQCHQYRGKSKYHGPVDPEQVDELLCDAIALVLPTYMDGEGYPGSIIEALWPQLGAVCQRS